MFAVGSHGIDFRGVVTDYGNSTYLIEYYPTRAGTFNLYVTIGCCPPDPAVGYPASLAQSRGLLIKGSPFQLVVRSAKLDQTRTVATGGGLVGGMVGAFQTFTIFFRDVYDNPTISRPTDAVSITIEFRDQQTNDEIEPDRLIISNSANNATVVYNITRAAHYWMHVSVSILDTTVIVSNNNLQNSTTPVLLPILGSPFSVYMSPTVAADPSHTVCRGVGLRQATVGQTASFQVSLFDNYRNALLVGGNKFFIRLVGDSSFANPTSLAEAPHCADIQKGSYLCSYTPLFAGPHQLVVRLLLLDVSNSNSRGPGGSGLLGSYYSSVDGSLRAASAPLANVVRVDPAVSFLWPSGFIIPSSASANSSQVLPLERSGQSVRWEGYLVSPRTDTFNLSAITVGINVTIFCDEVLVFDSFQGKSSLVNMVLNGAYHLLVLASVQASSVSPSPVSIDLRWSTKIIPSYTIPAFFLYPFAADVAYSPFPVIVN